MATNYSAGRAVPASPHAGEDKKRDSRGLLNGVANARRWPRRVGRRPGAADRPGGGRRTRAGRPARAVVDAEAQRVAAIEKAEGLRAGDFRPGGQGGGSGVVISPDGYALTNFHVVAGCGKAMQCGMADGKLYDAVIVGIDPTGDVAVIKLFGRDDFPRGRNWADSDAVRPGDWVFAMGNPFLLATDLQPTVTYGIVSGVHRYQPPSGTFLEYADCIQTDASINPGNSGGPLFDAQGRLIGINGRGSFQKRGRVNVGVGYAISINQIKRFLGALRGGRIVDHATLGVQVLATTTAECWSKTSSKPPTPSAAACARTTKSSVSPAGQSPRPTGS